MKGVIVQIGNPKSIVLFNNGKIKAIPTPANCQVGMVVTVKYNSLVKILLISFISVLLVAIGIFIGMALLNSKANNAADAESPAYIELRREGRGPHGSERGHWHRGRHMMERSP